MRKLKIIDLFCGAGGLSYGFSKYPQFEIVAANDILPDMATAYQLNHKSAKVYCSDIKDFNSKLLSDDLNVSSSDIDIIIGGPPCQAYSTVGKRLIDDPRGKLFQEYFRILKEFKPELFIFENVRGLLSMQRGELLKIILSLFRSLGYEVDYKVLDAANFGTPQHRQRVIIVGHLLKGKYQFPDQTHSEKGDLFTKPYLTLGEAVSDLPLIKARQSSDKYSLKPQNEYQKAMRDTTVLKDHDSPNYNPNLIALMKALPEGGCPRDIPEKLRPSSGFGNSYCRLWWNKPSTTVTRNLGTPSSARCVHPKVARALTTREGARLQGFPDSYIFVGSRSSKNLQVGNAVPTQLSIALANSVLDFFHKNNLLIPDNQQVILSSENSFFG